MRTYRGILLAGVVLWLVGRALAAVGGGETLAAVAWLGQLLVVIGAAGVVMVWLLRQVMARRLRPPGEDDR